METIKGVYARWDTAVLSTARVGFLRPFLADYATLSSIYVVVRNAYAKTVYVDRAFQKKTNELVQRHIDTNQIASVGNFVEIGSDTIELIKSQKGGLLQRPWL